MELSLHCTSSNAEQHSRKLNCRARAGEGAAGGNVVRGAQQKKKHICCHVSSEEIAACVAINQPH